ncbi:MAG: hypothetical protein Q8880_11675 [Bacteroidota bacterium]|nr:hypothetical protein [Bacteroidota bacterium]
MPKVLIYNNLVFFVAQNIKKVKEIEDVLKSRMIVLNTGSPEWTFLSNDEIKFLGNWDSEKYRQKL